MSSVYLVGYATTLPQDVFQAVFALASVMISAVFFATIVGTVGALVQNIGKTKEEYMTKMDKIKSYMEFRKISKGRNCSFFLKSFFDQCHSFFNLQTSERTSGISIEHCLIQKEEMIKMKLLKN